MTNQELLLLAEKSKVWVGPNTWGWKDGYRLSLQEALASPGFG